MQSWMFREERIKAKEIISNLTLKEKLALLDELYTDVDTSSCRFTNDVVKEEWNKMVKRSGKGNMLKDIINMRYERNKKKIEEVLDSLTQEEKFALHDYLDLEEKMEDVRYFLEFEDGYEEYIDDEEMILEVAKNITFRDYDSNLSLNDSIEMSINNEIIERKNKNGTK